MEKYKRNKILVDYLASLGKDEMRLAHLLIRKECMISQNKLYNWKQCKANIEPIYTEHINRALGIKLL